MRNSSIVILGVLLLALTSRAERPDDVFKSAKFASKIAAAQECNVYVHFRKGKDDHCLFDPVKMNAVPLTVFEKRSTGDVVLSDAILKEGVLKQWRVNGTEFYAIFKNRRVVIVNIDTGQTGVIPLSERTK